MPKDHEEQDIWDNSGKQTLIGKGNQVVYTMAIMSQASRQCSWGALQWSTARPNATTRKGKRYGPYVRTLTTSS